MTTVKEIAVGNSLVIVLPKEVLARLRFGHVERLFATDSSEGGAAGRFRKHSCRNVCARGWGRGPVKKSPPKKLSAACVYGWRHPTTIGHRVLVSSWFDVGVGGVESRSLLLGRTRV
jgi:hypothetical protein